MAAALVEARIARPRDGHKQVLQRIREAAALVRGTQTGFISWSVTPAKGSTLRLPEQVEVLASLFAVVAHRMVVWPGPCHPRADRGT